MESHPVHRRRLPIEMAALGFLMRGPFHGYDLHRQMEQELGPVWRIGLSYLYNALKQLEKDGLVTSTTIPQENLPPRKIYAITPSGREVLLAWLGRPVPAVRDIRVEFLAKLYFCTLGMADPQALIAAQTAFLQERLAQIERAWTQTESEFYRLVLDLRRRQTRAALDWLQATAKTLLEEDRP